jgi:hypothetical protein
VRHAPRSRHRADVDEKLDAVVAEELDELVESSGRMPDRQD